MATLTNLSPNSLKYYINSRRLKSAFCFFNIEISFLRKLVQQHFLLLVGNEEKNRLAQVAMNLIEIVSEKKEIMSLLEHQLKDLEILAEKRSVENREELTARQAYLESSVLDWVNKYHEVKVDLFLIVETIIADDKLTN